jgi:Zn-dependent M28 family amino/carboxypeptidase
MARFRGARAACAALATTALLVPVLGTSPAHAAPNNNSVKKLTKAVELDSVLDHLEALQAIADANGGNRAAGLPGYRASVDYVVSQLEAAGYNPEVQEFPFDFVDDNSQLVRVSPSPRTFVESTDFLRNAFTSGTPEGEVTGQLVPVDLVLNAPSLPANTSTSGCEAADFTGFPAGSVALVQRGTCGFALKVLNAQASGAIGVVVMNEGQEGRTGLVNMSGDATGLTIPAVFTTFEAGLNLAQVPNSTVRVKVDFTAEERVAYNVIAETKGGDPNNVVMAGAHLDSVQEGPGINDNGSGSAALLETAIQMQKVKPNNQVRFAWWGAEEEGLLGSEFYVNELTQPEQDDIALYLNFDMVASPNYFFGIYDGDDSSGTAPATITIPEGSAQIEDVFEKFFANRGLPSSDTEFSGRSDYGPFIAAGVPAGGLFTGAEEVKTAAEVELYGGVAGVAYDPCYHSACDNLTGADRGELAAVYAQLDAAYDLIGNVNTYALDVNSDAIAAAIITFAFDTSTVNGQTSPGKSHGKANDRAKGKSTDLDQFKNRAVK